MIDKILTSKDKKRARLNQKQLREESERAERLAIDGAKRKERAKQRVEAAKHTEVTVPGEGLSNFDEIGWTWQDYFDLFENSFGIDRLVVIENYARFLNVPYLKKEQVKKSHKPKPHIMSQIARHCGYIIHVDNFDEEAEIEKELKFILENDLFPADAETNAANLRPKVPTLAIMGHVDHGKTTLLDYLRSSYIADGEAGGITQHMGAFTVKVLGKKMTVLDTPGHAAFHAIRERGANVVDHILLVVAADDGVMAQTIESVKFARKSRTPITFVVTKTDKKNANVERVRTLIRSNFDVDEAYPISAKSGKDVEEMLLCLSEKLEEQQLAASVAGHAEGHILEVKGGRPGVGIECTVLVSRGTLKPGQILISTTHIARVKALFDERGKKVKEARPGEFVTITGFKSKPEPGAFIQGATKQTAERAKKISRKRTEKAISTAIDGRDGRRADERV